MTYVKKGRARGERVKTAKLCEAHIHKIRSRYAAFDGTIRGMAREYDVSRQLILNVVNGTGWPHIGFPDGYKYPRKGR